MLGACAPRPAGCGCSMPYGRALHEREASVIQCKAMLLRVSCGVHFMRQFAHVTRLCATTLAVSGEEA